MDRRFLKRRCAHARLDRVFPNQRVESRETCVFMLQMFLSQVGDANRFMGLRGVFLLERREIADKRRAIGFVDPLFRGIEEHGRVFRRIGAHVGDETRLV